MAETPQVFTASGQTDAATAIATFKTILGGGDNGAVVGSQPGGFRHITWDDVPDSLADPNQLPFDYYNTASPRGALIEPAGYLPRLLVSANASNPTSTPPLFGEPSVYTAFSPQRIASAFGTAGSVLNVKFAVPGASAAAGVSGFGAVFTGVNLANTWIDVFDTSSRHLGRFNVPAASSHNGVSFLGVVYPSTRIAYVIVHAGTERGSQTPEDDTHDLVAVDDLIYGEPQVIPPPTITITSPSTASTIVGTGPFITLAGTALNGSGLTWTNDRGGSGTPIDGSVSGTLDWRITDIPLAPGRNVITLQTSNANGVQATTTVTVTSDVFAYYLAEGSTGSFFDSDVSIANPNAVTAPVTLTFLRQDGGRVVQTATLAPMSRKTVHVDDIPGLEGTAFSTVVVSDNRVPLIVERAMFWDRSYYGGKGATAVDQPSMTWYFAEGVQNSFFSTFILLENPNAEAADATLTFARQFGEEPVTQHVPLPPMSRITIDTGADAALVGRSFGLTVQATRPIIAERSTYFESTPTQLWAGGHGSPGVSAPSTTWLFAEGATGAFREPFLLLSNLTDIDTLVHTHYFLGSGNSVTTERTVPAHSRVTVPIKQEASAMVSAEFSISVDSQQPIIAERAMYWLGAPGPWADGTSTFGVQRAGLRWGFAEGRVGGQRSYHSYIRVAATELQAEVKVTFLRDDGTEVVRTETVPRFGFVTIDVNAIPELQDTSFATIIESTNGAPIHTERSMYWDSNGVFWAGGITTIGTHLP